MNKQLKKYVIFCLPLLIKYFFLLLFIDIQLFTLGEIFEDFIFCIVIYILLSLPVFSNPFVTNFLLFLYIFYFVLEATSYLAVASNFSSSYMYVLLESSKGEFQEFISSYYSFRIVLMMSILLGVLILLKKFNLIKRTNNSLVGLGIIIAIVLLLKWSGLIENNAYHNIVRGAYGYFDLQYNFQTDNLVEKEDVIVKTNNEILVLLLGESTTRANMQLYDYKRETTPYLSSFKDSLFIYNNVISSDVLTLKAVPKMLTSISNEQTEGNFVSIVDIFNKANFKTYWLSNQRPISYHDNAISKIASSSSFIKFYNHKHENFDTEFDEIMMSKYKDILAESGKKLVIIRLIGTHFDYGKRYPMKFEKFKSLGQQKRQSIINHYDNAILYNDYVVFRFLEELKSLNSASALVFLSDHGENVYHDFDFYGHSESMITKTMYDIPFILWTSPDFEFPDDFDYVPDRKFMGDHLYESLGHLFGVIHKNMNVTHSIFSNSFKERKRIIMKGIDYDTYFSKKND